MIASPRFTDKGARRKRGKSPQFRRRSHAKSPSPYEEGKKGGEKTWRIEKGFPGFGQVCGKALNELSISVFSAPVLFHGIT